MKTELSMVAARYAKAVLLLAFKEGGDKLADTVLADLVLINSEIGKFPAFEQILHHPSITPEQKRDSIVKAFKGHINDLSLRLVELMLDKRRFALLKSVEVQFRELLNKHKNILKADLMCAEPLTDKAVADIKARLTEHLGKKLDLAVQVDPSLIGGMVLRLGDQVLDGSLKGRLRELERTLLSV